MDDPSLTPAPARSRPPRRAAVVATACLAVAGFAIGVLSTRHNGPASAVATAATATTTPAAAPRPPFRGHGGPRFGGRGLAGGAFSAGTVASISASGFTVSGPSGSKITFTTSSSTTYSEVGVQVGRSALAVGEHVAIRTSLPASSGTTHAASAVELLLPEVEGKFVSLSGNRLIVEDDQGFWHTIELSSSTAYGEAGKAASESALKSGVYVLASGQIASDHTTLQASAVAVSTGGASAGGPAAAWPGFAGPLFGPGPQGAFFAPGPAGAWFGGPAGGSGSSNGGGSSAAQ
jgi:hypothetical protein